MVFRRGRNLPIGLRFGSRYVGMGRFTYPRTALVLILLSYNSTLVCGPLRNSSADCPNMTVEVNELDLLACCAQRFNAPQFATDHPSFNQQKALDTYFRKAKWPAKLEEKFAVFYFLQLCSSDSQDSPYWKAYRELFLELYKHDVPAQYMREEFCQRWRYKYGPMLGAHVSVVRQNHKNTTYRESTVSPETEEEAQTPKRKRGDTWLGSLFSRGS